MKKIETNKIENIIVSIITAMLTFGIGVKEPSMFIVYGTFLLVLILYRNRFSFLLYIALGITVLMFLLEILNTYGIIYLFVPSVILKICSYTGVGLSIINLFYVNDKIYKNKLKGGINDAKRKGETDYIA